MHLQWNLIVPLAALGLVRPLLSILDLYDGAAGPVLVTVATAVVWVAVTVTRRPDNPVAHLAATGGLYGLFILVLQPVVATFVPGGSPGIPVIGMFSVIVTNVVYGAILGLVAAGLMRVTGPRTGTDA